MLGFNFLLNSDIYPYLIIYLPLMIVWNLSTVNWHTTQFVMFVNWIMSCYAYVNCLMIFLVYTMSINSIQVYCSAFKSYIFCWKYSFFFKKNWTNLSHQTQETRVTYLTASPASIFQNGFMNVKVHTLYHNIVFPCKQSWQYLM